MKMFTVFIVIMAAVLATGQWSLAASEIDAEPGRAHHTATLLDGGRVLLIGGVTIPATLGGQGTSLQPATSTLVFNGEDGTWSFGPSLGEGRMGHAALRLSDGRVMVCGGHTENEVLSRTEILDGRNRWTIAGEMNRPRAGHSATLLGDSRVLVVGGDRGDPRLPIAELFDPATGIWMSVPGPRVSRSLHRATLLDDGRVMLTGGMDGERTLETVEVFEPADQRWSSAGELRVARRGHTTTLLQDGRALVVGGLQQRRSEPTASAELFDPATGLWSDAANLNAARAMHTATLLPDGKVLVAGGASDGGVLSSAEVYDPHRNRWAWTGELNAPRFLHTAVKLDRGMILIAGGSPGLSGPAAELYDPAGGNWLVASTHCPSGPRSPSSCVPTDGGCRVLMNQWPLRLIEEIRAARTPTGTAGCRGEDRGVLVQVEVSRRGLGWEKARIWIEGMLAEEGEQARRLTETARVRKIGALRDLPRSSTWSPLPVVAAQIRISQEGVIRITDGTNLAVPIFDSRDIESFASSVRRSTPGLPFEIEADKRLGVSLIGDVLHALKRAGVRSVGLRTEPRTQRSVGGGLLESVGGLSLPLDFISVTSPTPQGPESAELVEVKLHPKMSYDTFIAAMDTLASAESGLDLASVRLVLPLPQESADTPPTGSRQPASLASPERGFKLLRVLSPGTPKENVQPPTPLYRPQPEYTEIARKARVEGAVIIRTLIDARGRVTEAEIVEGLPMGLGQAALAAVRTWHFVPASFDGEPVAVSYEITVNFKLE